MPKDVLTFITSFLQPRDIEILAQTYNTRITPTCLWVLADWLSAARNERIMRALFGPPVTSTQDEIFGCSFDMREDLGFFSETPKEPLEQLSAIEYKELWDELTRSQIMELDMRELRTGSPDDFFLPTHAPEEVESLERVCNRLKVALPISFVRLMSNPRMRRLLLPANSSYSVQLDASNPLLKLISTVMITLPNGTEGSIDGYACRIRNIRGDDRYGVVHLTSNAEYLMNIVKILDLLVSVSA
jgi:hypothetical protein